MICPSVLLSIRIILSLSLRNNPLDERYSPCLFAQERRNWLKFLGPVTTRSIGAHSSLGQNQIWTGIFAYLPDILPREAKQSKRLAQYLLKSSFVESITISISCTKSFFRRIEPAITIFPL